MAFGSSTLSGIGASNSNIALSYTGDLAKFASFTANEAATPTWLTGNLQIRATFGAWRRDSPLRATRGMSAATTRWPPIRSWGTARIPARPFLGQVLYVNDIASTSCSCLQCSRR